MGNYDDIIHFPQNKGNLRFLDEAEMLLKLTDGTAIPIADITNIEILA